MLSRDNGRERDPLVRAVKFPLGQLLATPSAVAQVPPIELTRAMRRHAAGDWGELCDEDRATNDYALASGGRILSAYRTTAGVKFWIITEADRASTTALLPEEY